DDWKLLSAKAAFHFFVQRSAAHWINDLEPAQAVEMGSKAMRSRLDAQPGEADGCPFDLPSLQSRMQTTSMGARDLLRLCRDKYDDWLARGRNGLIALGTENDPAAPLRDAFVAEWN